MIGDLAATFVKLEHVLCNFSAIVIISVTERLQRGYTLSSTGVYILRIAREKTTQQVCTFDECILQQLAICQVKFIHFIFSNVWFYKCIFAT